VAHGLAAEGVHLALCARGEDRVIAAARAISEKYGIRAIGIKAYVSKSDHINHFVAEIEKAFGTTSGLTLSIQAW
jgi:short-subunit dehydrogenase